MKAYKLNIFLGLIVIMSFLSCESFLGGDVNVDPNRTNDAALNTLTPTILFYTAEATQQAAVVANAYSQHIGSVTAGGLESQNRNTFTGVWNNIYLNIIPNANTIIAKANETSSPHYSGIAKVVLAYNLGLGTTLWENIPFKDSDNNLSNFSPVYDSQEDIYKDILRLLDEAIADLGASSSIFVPRNDDIVYKGNIANWIKVAHTLKARYTLHLSKRQGASAYGSILASLANGISSNAEDMQVVYNERNLSRWHQVALANNTGNITTNFSSTFVNLMNGRVQGVTDPRIEIHAHKTAVADTIFLGMNPGTASGGNTRYNNGVVFFGWQFKVDAPLQLVTNAEARFIEAEARFLQSGPTDQAYKAYIDGISANMAKLGVSGAAIAEFTSDEAIGVGAEALTRSHILTEKYKAMFVHPEIWNDLRRVDYSGVLIPGLDLPANLNPDLDNNWIQRGDYPDSEASRNSAVVLSNTKPLTAKMWVFN